MSKEFYEFSSILVSIGTVTSAICFLIFLFRKTAKGKWFLIFCASTAFLVSINNARSEFREDLATAAGFNNSSDWSAARQLALNPASYYLHVQQIAEQDRAKKAVEDEKLRLARIQDAERSKAAEHKKLVEEAANKKRGFHCLSGWDGSSRSLVTWTKNHLHDPKSFEQVETRIAPVNANEQHSITMTYRASNAFGALRIETVRGFINNSDCNLVAVTSF